MNDWMDNNWDDSDWDDDEPDLIPVQELLDRLDDPDPQTRSETVAELWNYANSEAMERLIDLAQRDPDPTVRRSAIGGLGRYIYEAVIMDWDHPTPYTECWLSRQNFESLYDLLLGIYRDPNRSFDEQCAAVEALSFWDDDTVSSLIMSLYRRPEKSARISALFAMGRNGGDDWDDILEREIWNSDPDIQIQAIESVGELSREDMGRDLLRLTYYENKDVVMAAIWAMGQTGWSEAFDRLDELALDPDPDISQLADAAMDEWMLFNQFCDTEPDDEPESDWMP